METLYFRICVVLGLLAGAVIVVLPLRRQFADFHEFVRRTPKWQRAFLALLAAVFIAYGSTKTNRVNQVEGGRLKVEQWNLPTCSAGQPEQGFNFLCSTSTLGFDYLPHPSAGRLPVGAILATNWWRRGCWEDCRKIEFADGWVFPFGTNHFSSVVVMSQGGVRTGFCDASEIAALGTKVALVPFDSCFSHEHTPSNSYRFAWGRAYVGRDTNTPMTASIELFRTGDVCVTTNGVPTVEPYVIPFPHVGVGQNDDWVRTNFLNAAEILSAGYADWVDAKVGVDLDNGLYKFTATFPVDPPEATELFVGDLSVCVTNAGEYVFLLEKGVEYSFGTNPFDATVDYSMQDDLVPPAPLFASWWSGDDNGVWTVDGGESRLYWPTLFGYGTCLWEPTFFGSPDVAGLAASDFPMTFTAVFLDCCRTNGATYHWTSPDERVNILSPNAQTTEVEIDSSLSGNDLELSVEACTQDRNYYSTLRYHIPTNENFGFSLAMPDTLFVNDDDDDGNGETDQGPDTVGEDDVATAEISLSFPGGPSGTLELVGVDGFVGDVYEKIDSTYAQIFAGASWRVSDSSSYGKTLYFDAKGKSSGYRQSTVRVRWRPDDGGAYELTHGFTVVYPIVGPICSVRKSAVENGVERQLTFNSCGVAIGRDAYFRVEVQPRGFPDSKIVWSAVGEGSVSFPDGNTGREVRVRGFGAGDVELRVQIGDCTSSTPSFPLRVVESTVVNLSAWIVADGESAACEINEVRNAIKNADDIFAQVGVTFNLDNRIVVTNIPAAFVLNADKPTEENWSYSNLVANVTSDADGIRVYFVDKIIDDSAPPPLQETIFGLHGLSGIAVAATGLDTVLAHELGHAFGMEDVYANKSGVTVGAARASFDNEMFDWNNGSRGRQDSGTRYYEYGIMQKSIIERLLMNGHYHGGADISAGPVFGVKWSVTNEIYKTDYADIGAFVPARSWTAEIK